MYHSGEVTNEHKENAKLKSSPTTQLIKEIVFSDGSTVSYEYDAEERITKGTEVYPLKERLVTDEGVSFRERWVTDVTEYTYDALGQLLTETKNGEMINQMTYDAYGNICSKNGKTYSYGDSKWKDLLTQVDGKWIDYDDQGNPIIYLDTNSLYWGKGRQLEMFTKCDEDYNEICRCDYTYNANGIRTSKTVNNIRHDYLLEGTKILRETWQNKTLIPLYDNQDQVCGISYKGILYSFLKNLQGDVVALVDDNGETVARYSYDAFGVPTVLEDHTDIQITRINPFLYRGYYYDWEIGMYYLQSRYYDPNLGRFLNGDDTEFLGGNNKVLSWNLFAYCENDSIGQYDPLGTDAYWITDSKTLAGAGHSSLLICVNNSWYYFYFGAKKFLKPVNGPSKVIFEKISGFLQRGRIDYDKLNNKLMGGIAPFTGDKKYEGKGYNKSFRIKGNFNSAYNYIKNSVKYKKYNIAKENCAWMCIEVLKVGGITNDQFSELLNIQYRTFRFRYWTFRGWKTKTYTYANVLVPSVVHNKVCTIFNG